MLDTPVILLIFNRPDTTAQVFARIAEVRPTRLLVVADGPRPGVAGDPELCSAARSVTEQVDWDCAVTREYAPANMGCGKRVSSGLNWAFSQVEEAIVLEDDCVPDASFFRFCHELLGRYRDDERVFSISGNNFHPARRHPDSSYFFSLVSHIWGWATWRRAWAHFDLALSQWPTFRDGSWLSDLLDDPPAEAFWRATFDRAWRGVTNAWGWAWTFAGWSQGGLSVIPGINLVTNVGFDSRATHTTSPITEFQRPAGAIDFPLRHPPFMIRDRDADRFIFRQNFGIQDPRSLSDQLRGAGRRANRELGRLLGAMRSGSRRRGEP